MTQAPSKPKIIVLAITGASGAIYAFRLLQFMKSAGVHVHLAVSQSARLVILQELGIDLDLARLRADDLPLHPGTASWPKLSPAMAAVLKSPHGDGNTTGTITCHHHDDLMAPIASGSFLTDGMVICPCSGSTLGAVVHGTGENLIHRAASVHLKERRKLIVVPRETPLSTIQLDNMRRAAEAGAVVLPAMPGFYHGATTLGDLVDFIVARILDQLGIENTLMHRWGS